MPTQEQLDKLKEQLDESEAALKLYMDEVRLAEKAGYDMPDKREEGDKVAERLRRIRRTYGV